MHVVTAEEMRELERLTVEHSGTPSHILMERAGAGATEVLLNAFPRVRTAPVLVFAGKGNNGGGWVRHCPITEEAGNQV